MKVPQKGGPNARVLTGESPPGGGCKAQGVGVDGWMDGYGFDKNFGRVLVWDKPRKILI